MELKIAGRHAVVCGGSRGLGRAAAMSLAREGVRLTLVARSLDQLVLTAAEIAAETNVDVKYVAADITTEAGRTAVLADCPNPDMLVTNPGVRQVPEDFRTMTRDRWNYWMDAHFYSSLELIRAVAPGMCERGFGRIVNVKSWTASIGRAAQGPS